MPPGLAIDLRCGCQQVSDVWIAGRPKSQPRALVDIDRSDASRSGRQRKRDRIATVRRCAPRRIDQFRKPNSTSSTNWPSVGGIRTARRKRCMPNPARLGYVAERARNCAMPRCWTSVAAAAC